MINVHRVKTYSVAKRYSKVRAGDFAAAPRSGASFRAFFDSLPHILKAQDVRMVVADIVRAHRRKKAVIFMMGAHVIKCGLNPVLIELIRKKIITCLCTNGAGLIHDFEIALQGKTSEDVARNLEDGSFGMGRETADFVNTAAKEGVQEGLGLGAALARKIWSSHLKYKSMSVLASCHERHVPVCAFVSIGADIVHQHPSFNAAFTAEGSVRDFYTLAAQIKDLHAGGVVCNFGSAVIMPEVFLKALNLCRNLGSRVRNFTTANFDMMHQYRAAQNIVARPVSTGGRGYYIIGHHELMLPLVAHAVLEGISSR
jgi:hypothetical protein